MGDCLPCEYFTISLCNSISARKLTYTVKCSMAHKGCSTLFFLKYHEHKTVCRKTYYYCNDFTSIGVVVVIVR